MKGRIKLKGNVKKMHGFHSVSPVNSYKLELQRGWQRGEAADDLILTNCSFWAREKTGASLGGGGGNGSEGAGSSISERVLAIKREVPCGSPDPTCHCASLCPSIGSFLQGKKSWRRDREAKP